MAKPARYVDREFVRQNWGVMTQLNIARKFGVSRQRIKDIAYAMSLPPLKISIREQPRAPRRAASPNVAESDFIQAPTLAQLMGRR